MATSIPYYINILNREKTTPLAPYEVFVATEIIKEANITAHRHSYFELIFTTEGSGIQLINGIEYLLEPGVFTLITPYQVREVRPRSEEGIIQKRIAFDTSLLLKYIDDEETRASIENSAIELLPSFRSDQKEKQVIEDILSELEREAQEHVFGSEISPSLALQAFVLFLRAQKRNEEVAPQDKKSVWEAYRYLYQNSSRQIDAETTALELGWDVGTLKKQLYLTFDMSFGDILNEMRTRNAASLLLAFPDMAVLAIAKNVGYTSNATFFRVFDKYYGMTPATFRNTYLSRTSFTLGKVAPLALYGNIITYLYQHYDEELKLTSLAHRFSVNEQQLNDEFSIYFGMSYSSFLSLIRVKKAASLLRATNQPINLISEKVGFNSVRTFTRAFQKYTGFTPAAYRNRSV